MQVTTLLNPGQNPLAQTIRKEVARVISQLEIADVTGTPEPLFAAFLADAAAKTPGSTSGAFVANGATVNVENSAGALDSPATAVVAAGVLTGVNLAATKTIVTHAQSINVENSVGGLDTAATAVVAAGVITGVNLPSTTTLLAHNVSVAVRNSALTAIPGSHGSVVAAGVLTGVNLASTVGVVVNGVKQSGWTVTGSGTFFTPTIVAGVCTGGVLSAS